MNGTIPKILRVSDLKRLSLDTLIEAYKNGYRVEGGYAVKKTSMCPIISKTVGDTLSISASPDGGVPPYTIEICKDGNVIKQFTEVEPNESVTHVYTLLNTDIGTRTFSATVYDSHSTISPKEECTVIVLPCPIITAAFVSCPSITATQGDTVMFSAIWKGGKEPFTIKWYKDSDATPFAATAATKTTASISSVIKWSVRNHTVKAIIIDSCIPPQSYSTKVCTISVVASDVKPFVKVNIV